MKKIVSIFPLVILLFFSCKQVPPDPYPPIKPVEEKKSSVVIKNQSQYDVNLYFDNSPYYKVTPTYTINKKTDYHCELLPSDDTGYTVYIEYLIDIGNAQFPYWDIESSSGHKDLIVKENTSAELVIDSLEECVSNSAYFYIENNTTSDIFLQNGSFYVRPSGQEEYLISSGKAAVYEVNETTTAICFDNYSQLKLFIGNDSYSLPITKESIQKGNIYTISVSAEKTLGKTNISASLKAVTPFNIDTQNKIWALDNPIFSTEYPIVMRPSYDGKSTLVMGSARKNFSGIIADGPGIICLDEYGNNVYGDDKFFSLSSNPECLKTSKVIDFIEQQDDSVVILCNNIYKNGDDDWEDYLIVRYDFKTKTPMWYKFINSSVQLQDGSWYTLVFRNDSKNKLIKLAEDKFVCVGAYDHFAFNQEGLDYDRLHYMIIYIDGTNTNSEGVVAPESFKTIFSTDYTDLTKEIERNLTSAYYDGTDLYICGYDNWEHTDYTTTHVGKIWKASITDLANGVFDFSNNIVYSCDNCLFFSIDGIGSNYVVCGEYKDKGKVLKGCHVTSGMIKADAACTPVLYTVQNKQSCWFNQLCQYENKIVLCGKAAASMDGKDSPLPFVVAYDSKGNKLWENLSFTNYTSALNIIPNTIGTYMLQLEGKNGIIHYVNADLLGNEKK